MKTLFEQLGEALDPKKNAELLRLAKIEAEIKQIENES